MLLWLHATRPDTASSPRTAMNFFKSKPITLPKHNCVLAHALKLPSLQKLVGKRVILASNSPRRREILHTFVSCLTDQISTHSIAVWCLTIANGLAHLPRDWSLKLCLQRLMKISHIPILKMCMNRLKCSIVAMLSRVSKFDQVLMGRWSADHGQFAGPGTCSARITCWQALEEGPQIVQ